MIIPLFLKNFRYIFFSVVLGIMLFNIHNFKYYFSDEKLEQFDGKIIKIKGIVREHKNFRFNSVSMIEAESFSFEGKKINLPIIVSTYSNKSYDHVVNDSIIVTGKFQRFKKARNLYEKDEESIARDNKISGYMLSPKIISHRSLFSVSKIIHIIRSKIINIFNEKLSYRSSNFMNAIMIGSRESLEKSTIKEFSDSGTIHLLAVSGLHVGFLLLILTFFKRILGTRISFHIVITITVLIFYVLLTGSSPSVMRAAIMSIISLLCYPMKRKMKITDIIATAGMFSLIIDPNQIFKLGFILSFTAVLSLVVIYKFITELPQINSMILRLGKFSFLFKGFLVSVSASIGTLPVVLYYFGKFNLFSIFINVILIPLTGLNYLLGIVLIFIYKIPLLSNFIAFMIESSVNIMMKMINFASNADPMKIIYKINILELSIALSLIVIIFVINSYKVRIVLLFIMIIILMYSIFSTSQRNHLYYFSTVKGNTAFASLDGQNILFLGEISERELNSIIKPYLIAKNIRSLDYIILMNDGLEDEDLINEMEVSINYIVNTNEQTYIEGHQMINIDPWNRSLCLLNSRIYFSEKMDKAMLVYAEHEFLFGKSKEPELYSAQFQDHLLIFGDNEFNTEKGGVIIEISTDELESDQFEI
ncbi:MAG: ComEC/Rec2 family competence protein [Candidatus Delongbacteria bacterium]|nr:ComEC/Rec2 family competence protein [Candidatus Delongbacteria bacterium]